MGRLLSYAIVSGLVMLAMYLVYKLMIARDNQHGFNRGVLLSIYLVSFCAWPAYNFIDSLSQTPAEVEIPAYIMPQYIIASENMDEASQPVWGTILIWIFLAGAAVVAIKTLATWISILRLIHSGEHLRQDGNTLVVIDRADFAPFSWLRYVVVSREDFEVGRPAITAHELKHLRSLHWIDLLIAQMVCVVEWFNPAAWLMREELMLVHEYQADMAVIDSGCDPQEYQMLLVKKAVGARFPSLANSMNHSKLKKRITMMYKSKSSAGSRLKALALVPMAALAIAVVSIPAVKAAMATIGSSDISLGKDSENLPEIPQEAQETVLLDEMQVVALVPGETSNDEESDKRVETKQEATAEPEASINDKADENSSEPSSDDGIVITGYGMQIKHDRKTKIDADYLKDKLMVTFISDDDKVTTINVEGGSLGNAATVSGATLTNKGTVYHAKSISKTLNDGIASITSVFPSSGDFENASLILTINGKEEKFALRDHKKFRNNGITWKPAGSDKYYDAPSDLEIYLDGKKITDDELKALDPSAIASIDVYRHENRINITSKQAR